MSSECHKSKTRVCVCVRACVRVCHSVAQRTVGAKMRTLVLAKHVCNDSLVFDGVEGTSGVHNQPVHSQELQASLEDA